MKKILYATTAFILCGIAQSQAACIATPSCTSLGYTSTSSCTNGIKCPFGNYWNCDLANKITELEKTIENIKQESATSTCKIGSILYSDMSCADDVVAYKTPIGVIVYMGPRGYQAMALKSLDTKYKWSTESVGDISGLPNLSESDASKDYASCENSKIIMAAGDKNKYPAVWAAHEYSTEGTKAGDWCLPAAGIFTLYNNNQEAINTGFSRADGTKFTFNTDAWSSSEYDNSRAWYSRLSNTDYGLYYNISKSSSQEVRPVLEF